MLEVDGAEPFNMIALSIISRLLLAVVFAIAGIAKLSDLGGTRKTLADFGVPEFLARGVTVLLPLFELACAAALIPSVSAWWGAVGVLAMLLLFTGAIGVNMARGRTPDCHCFGQLHSEPIGWKTIVRNVGLSAIAALVVWQGPQNAATSPLAWLGGLSHLESVVFALAGLAAFQLWFSFHLLRQNGRLMLRVETIENKAGSNADPVQPGLPVDSAAPDFSLAALDGGTVTLDLASEAGKPLVLVFSEPQCSICDALLPDLAAWQREFQDRLWIGLVSRGTEDANRAKIAKHEIRNVLLQKKGETASAYGVEGTPSAVLVMDGLIASPLAVGPDAIRSLVSRATLPPPVGLGDPVPSFRLADLTGNSLDLSTLRGHRTLLLFWNPTCGFCQQMLADVKGWERNPPKDAPQLLVISSGSFDANREQGFRSRVLLDPNFAAGHVFSAGGTPSAVMLDEEGKIASEVRVGASDVLELAGSARAANGSVR
jgi:peroxiredoxin/uncharacterized membrane protein YphA (DoxX/SURF4 family)